MQEPAPRVTSQSANETPTSPESPPPLKSDEILGKLGIGLIEISPSGIITNVDTVTAAMINYANPTELLRDEGSIKDMIFVDKKAVNFYIQQIMQSKKPITFPASLDGPDRRTHTLITAYPVFNEKGEIVSIRGTVQEAPVIEEKDSLRITMCSGCKKTRDENGQWNDVEGLLKNAGFALTHGFCPDCLEKHYPELYPPTQK
jgi:hypothetical protein